MVSVVDPALVGGPRDAGERRTEGVRAAGPGQVRAVHSELHASNVRRYRRRLRAGVGEALSLDWRGGVLLGVRPGVRAGRGVHDPGRAGRPRRQRRDRARAGARVPRRRGRRRGVPRAVPERLLHRRPPPAGHPADRGRRTRSPRSSPASADLLPVLVVGAPLMHGTRLLNCAVVIKGGRILGRRAEVLPAELPRVLRAPPLRARRRPAGYDDPRRRRRGAARPRPDLRRHRPARPPAPRRDLRGHVGAGAAERRGRAGRRDGAVQPVGQPDHDRPRRGPPAAGPQRQLPRATRPTSSPPPARASRPPTCRGTARPWSTSAATCSARASASPTGRAAPSSTSTSTGSGRSGCGRAPTTTTGADSRRPARSPFRTVEFELDAADRRHRAAPQASTASRSCPTTSSGWRWTATRPTTSRSPGSMQRLQAIGQPKAVIGVSGGLDSTHALIVAAKAMDRLGRPRSDVLAFTMPGFATGDTTKSLRDPARGGARRDLRGDRHQAGGRAAAQGPRPPGRRRRGGVRRHLRERPGRACATTTSSASPTSAAASSSAPATSASSRSAGARTASATRCRTTTSTPACRRP